VSAGEQIPAEAGGVAGVPDEPFVPDAADAADAAFEEPVLKQYLHVVPPGWPRGVLVGATVMLSALVALADVASAWVLLVLPALVAVVVAYHEALHRIVPGRG
jgi:hypothetical protein